MRRVLTGVAGSAALLVVLAGCAGSGSDSSAAAADGTPTTPTASTPAPTATATGPQAAPGDLLSFFCAVGADGKTWTAKGVIVNSAAKADYRVTVLVAPPGVTEATARRLVVPGVQTGVETSFTLDRLPVNPGSPADCRVQLVRLG